MNKFYKILFLISILIVGCKTIEKDEIILSQSIDILSMNIFSNEGEKLFTIESPYSNYDKGKNTFNLKNTTINLFKNDKIKYIINSDSSQLSNNNNFVELNGKVLVKTITTEGDKLYANRFTWNIQDSEYLLIGNVKFENNLITLSSNKATLNRDNNVIEFFNPVKYILKSNNNESSYEINSENAYYNIDTKSVSFRSKGKRVRSKIRL